MKYIPRTLTGPLRRAARHFPALLVTGPRRSGKTTLLKGCFPKASYYLLEDPDVVALVRRDPRSFLERLKIPVILDEIQNIPELFNYIRTLIDTTPQKSGQWLFTGSQEAPLMRGVTESMAGRMAIFQLLPLSLQETRRVSMIGGGFPEAISRPAQDAELWFRSYIQTYIERDVRAVSSIRDLGTFRRFLMFLASRIGQTVNRSEIAAPLGVSVPTISEWINILEVTHQILLIPPYYENFGKRITKSPKLYFVDSGLACHLLGIESEKQLLASVFLGPVFENFIASEIVKRQLNAGRRREIYYYRDQQGREVDFLIPAGGENLIALEIKASRTVRPGDAEVLRQFSKHARKYRVRAFVIHWPSRAQTQTSAITPGVRAISFEELDSIFS